MRQKERRRDPTARSPHAIAILALSTLAAIVLGLAALSYAAQQRNEREAAHEKARIADAVRDQHEAVRQAVIRLSVLPRFDAAPPDIGILDQVLLVNVKEIDSIAALAGTRAESSEVDRSIIQFTRALSAGSVESAEGMISAGDLFDTVALPVAHDGGARPDGARPLVVGLRQIDPSYLDQIASAAHVRGLKLVRTASDGSADPGSWASKGWGGSGLIWEQARPGDQLMLNGTVIAVAITSIIAVLIIQRARREAGKLHASEARAIEASRNDWLSGLPNRVFFNHVLERDLKALKHGQGKLALFYLDVDRFKDINDTFGMEAGDAMIQAVTRRIEAVVGQGQSVARFEGDTFSILQPGIQDSTDCERLAERLQQAMKAPFAAGDSTISLSLSVGVAIAPDDATERAELIRLANLALYRAKREGRNRLAFYKPALQDEWRRRTSIERELRDAITHGGLVLRYQPIVDCDTGRVVCAEALVRWNHPTEGLIAPDRFIGLAEDRGLILPLGEWVLREACAAARNWPDISIAVNISPIQLRQQDFVDTVARLLDETQLEPSRLELELTEGVLVEYEAEALATMAALRRRGIRLALDDFGTGYSSLIYLRRFAIDKIKIDRAFVEALEPGSESAILVDSVVKLGRALGLTVTAEGIETPAQRDFLRSVGCHQLQGYLIARPLSEVEFTAFRRQGGTAHGHPPVRAVA